MGVRAREPTHCVVHQCAGNNGIAVRVCKFDDHINRSLLNNY